MAEKAQGSEDPQGGQKKSRRGILQSTKMAWVQLDEQLPPGSEEESQGHMDSILEDSKKASIQQWLDSGLFISVNENFQQVIHHPVSLPEQGVVQMTVKEYMRTLHHFSETPTLSRGTSFNSYHSEASIPQSIPEWLEFCEKDPVEILLDLGFGADEPDICTQIPARFLGCASAARGINIRVFLEAQKQRMDIENPNLYGRFQQLEILDHVASAFSSLLNDVNILQEEAKEKDWGEGVQKSSAKECKEQRRRMGKLFRKVSKQSIRRNCNSDPLGPLKRRDISFITPEKPGACGVELSASQYSHDHDCRHLSPLAEQPSLQASDDLTPYHPPCALRPHSPRAAKQMPPCCVFNGSIKEGTRKENSVQTDKLKNFFLCMGNAPDSFEMEEVQSFEEETGNPLDVTPETVGAMNRANSCQSDSSGFLEEPEPAPLQMPSLPGSQRQAGDRCPTPRQQSPSRGSPQDWQQESDESDSRSMMSASFSSQDWSALEEKVSTPVAESGAPLENAGGSVEPLNPEKVGYKTTRAGDGARTDAWARAGPRVAAGTVTASRAWPLAFTSGRAAEVKDVGVRPEGTADVRKPSQRCPDVDNTSVTLEGPPQRALKPSDITPSRADVIQTSDKAIPGSETLAEVFPQEKPRCSALTPETPSSGSGVRNLPPGADSRSGSSRCVTTQPAPQLPSAARTAEAPGTAKGRTSERTECEPMTTGPGQGREAKQFRDASVQTYQCEPRPWHCRWAHTAQPLDKSISLGMGFPALRPEGTCYPAHAHCCSCCRRCPHCPSERREPRPAPSACVHCACSHHGHPEAQFTKMLEILQEIVVTELSSCTIHEMEVMKTLCRAFRTHLEEIEAHLTGQQTLFSRDMTEEEREEAQQLQTLREALRQQVEELEFQLGDRAQQIRQSILLVQEQFELLTGKTPEHCPNPHQLNWTGARNAPTAFPPEDRQQASRSDTTLLADLPPSALGSSPGMSPPAQAESGPTPLSDCPVGGKGMNVFL